MHNTIMRVTAVAVLLPLVLGFVPSAPSTSAIGDGSFLVSPSWLAQLGGDPNVALVDTRPASAYAQGHIPGALNVPWQLLDLQTSDESDISSWDMGVMQRLGATGITPTNIVVSYDDNGNLFASRLRWMLKYLGHERAVVLDGGIGAWTEFGGALTDEATSRPPATYRGNPKPERLATWRYVYDRLADPTVQIVDVRPLAAYTGDDPGSYRHAGHIPGAVNVDWNSSVQSDTPRTFKSLAELQSAFDAVGLDRNKEIIVYCVSGAASANTLFVLDMLGYPHVRLYSSSWAEWGNRDDLPFATGTEPGAVAELTR